MEKFLKIIGAWTVVITIVLSLSYCSELPKYRFERYAMEVAKNTPGSRVISTLKSADLASPVSWFRPTTTTWNFAVPDPLLGSRFYTFTLAYGEKMEPFVFLIDVNCAGHEITWYDLEEPESALPARDLYGNPVKAPSGKTYRRSKLQPSAPPEEMHEYCETDWSAERKAASQ